ncbi:type IX secretion system sortase PorU [Marivirga atlantica]|uniref:Type IX secretion system sortase PorU n=1 Tax=Marivirga atlantica TaxID=1548457 RepID=A0A937AB15_9BACT|nr:type IX secretion system sortase PorU [Marivirga atlantica]MBL0766900.1 type IX secretion system sortase PorU [Marivirga atlantica]
MFKRLILLLIILCAALVAEAQSVLTQSNVLKIATSKEGVYKIDASLLKSAGFNPSEIDPNKIGVYGMPGGSIPQANSIAYPNSPQQLAISKEANSNSSFESNEYILFYADHVDNIQYDFAEKIYSYSKNIYSDSLYFFIAIDDDNPQKLIQIVNESTTSTNTFNWSDQIYLHERELVNVLSSGRKWFGESFLVEKSRSFTFDLRNELASNQPIVLNSAYVGQSTSVDSLRISVNDFQLIEHPIPNISDSDYTAEGRLINNFDQISTSILSGRSLEVTLEHINSKGNQYSGYLDYLYLQVPEQNIFDSEQLVIRNRNFQLQSNFKVAIDLASEAKIWDVSDELMPRSINHNSGGFSFKNTNDTTEVKFVVFNQEIAYKPTFIESVDKLTLNTSSTPDFLIISHPAFIEAANKLASHRSSFSGFDVTVASTSDIFNEFGSGRRDVSALRNYIRKLYRQAPNKLKYVLMMGSGSYDYKNRVSRNTNYVPIYQSRESLDPVATYASDDFFVFMDDNEGAWEENTSNNDQMDLGIGRITARNLEDALHTVDKIIRYDKDPILKGKWRNELYYVADDEDNPSSSDINQFYKESQQLIDFVVSEFDYFNINKLFLGAYEQEAFASSERSPEMKDAINKMMEKGALLVNYIGHGAEESWTNEAILTNSMIRGWNNTNHFPLFVTATCEFGRHDNPFIVSGAQKLLHKHNSGAIALLTTSRPVYSSSNLKLNKAFYANAFKRENNTPQRLGDIIRETKNNSISDVNNRNFILLGDPSMTLGLPKEKIIVDELYNENGPTDTLRSLDKVSITGHIENFNGARLNDFDGEVIAELFDKAVLKETKEDEKYQFESFESVLYRGRGSVNNGEFTLTFYLPKEINYQNGLGKLSMYAANSKDLTDANGFKTDFTVGGSSNVGIEDDISPDITAFLNDSTFQNGDEVGSKNDLLISLYDEYGISISQNGLNNGVYFQLDDREKTKINDFFYYEKDSYQKGSVQVSLPELEEGMHQLKVGAVDVFNNPSETFIDFYVVSSDQLNILDFLVYPNPAQNNVNLVFAHNRKGEELEVNYEILDGFGRMVFSDKFVTSDLRRQDSWNLRAGGGEKIKAGIYFISLNLRSTSDASKTRQIKKLIVVN